jgi:hypothetical protein
MKAQLVKIGMVIGLATLAFAFVPEAAYAARDVVTQCAKLERKVAKHTFQVKRLMKKSNRRVSGSAIKALKQAKRKFSAACEANVCADMNKAICNSVGGDFCIQVVRPRTFDSIADMVKAGGVFMYAGSCSDEFNFGAPGILNGGN